MGLSKFFFQSVLGWSISGTFDPAIKKAVIIVVPHTSWHDFYIGVFTRRILKIDIHFLGKKELFVWPFGWYFRWMGGVPLDRTPGQKKTEAIAEIFEKRDEFRLSLSPEGTRKKVTEWKTGFYYIAVRAKVPIYCVSFDYRTKTVTIPAPFYPTGDIDSDLPKLKSHYEGVVGKIPEYS